MTPKQRVLLLRLLLLEMFGMCAFAFKNMHSGNPMTVSIYVITLQMKTKCYTKCCFCLFEKQIIFFSFFLLVLGTRYRGMFLMSLAWLSVIESMLRYHLKTVSLLLLLSLSNYVSLSLEMSCEFSSYRFASHIIHLFYNGKQ